MLSIIDRPWQRDTSGVCQPNDQYQPNVPSDRKPNPGRGSAPGPSPDFMITPARGSDEIAAHGPEGKA
jgi:hypothetical protein